MNSCTVVAHSIWRVATEFPYYALATISPPSKSYIYSMMFMCINLFLRNTCGTFSKKLCEIDRVIGISFHAWLFLARAVHFKQWEQGRHRQNNNRWVMMSAAGNGLAEKATAEVSNSGHVKWRTENPFVSSLPLLHDFSSAPNIKIIEFPCLSSHQSD